jgi:hypothetical protein
MEWNLFWTIAVQVLVGAVVVSVAVLLLSLAYVGARGAFFPQRKVEEPQVPTMKIRDASPASPVVIKRQAGSTPR